LIDKQQVNFATEFSSQFAVRWDMGESHVSSLQDCVKAKGYNPSLGVAGKVWLRNDTGREIFLPCGF